MVIYHGSDHIIEKPIYGYGKSTNDYGYGFYCTEDIELAMEWAVNANSNGYANMYDIDLDGLSVLRLTDDSYSTLNWISTLLDNRHFEVNSPLAFAAKQYLLDNFLPLYQNYDLIIGYRADDSYFQFARDFINNTISLRQLNEAMHYGQLGEQVVLKSEKAFELIEYRGNEKADCRLWYPRKERRDIAARKQYYDLDKNKYLKDDIYVMTILNEEMKNNDARLR